MMSLFRVVLVVSEKVYRYGVCMIFIYFFNLSTELCVSTACGSVGAVYTYIHVHMYIHVQYG